MKVIIELGGIEDDLEVLKIDTIKEYYEKYFNRDGILFNEELETIYYETEISFVPMEGQRVGTKFGTCMVDYSFYNLDCYNDTAVYYDKSRIIVYEE